MLLRVIALLTLSLQIAKAAEPTTRPGLVLGEFIDDAPAVRSCHASTIAQTRDGLVAAWFGGTRERNPDVGIWFSRHTEAGWSKPVEVANGIQADGPRQPCWNPVLFQPSSGPLMLFYKVGPAPRAWWGMVIVSDDGGKTWSKPRRLPDRVLGPIKNKPIELAGGQWLSPSSTENDGRHVHLELSADQGKTWTVEDSIADPDGLRAIQPTILIHDNGRLQILCRARNGRLAESWSDDNGKSWTPLGATSLPNPNSGVDAVTLRDGRCLLVYNHSTDSRIPLDLAISTDGKHWKSSLELEPASEPGQNSYPAVIQSDDGMVHITYTWRRKKIRHVVLDPAKLPLQDMRPLAPATRQGDPE